VAQARNEESAERLRVEATRRGVIQAVVNSWNQWVTAERNLEAQELQRKAAAIFYEGSLEEYREGLRSTFDVLFAQNSLNEAEIDLLASRRESYVARAALLRQIGMLEADRLLTNAPAYDPDAYLDRVEQRNAVPWGPVVRALDGLTAPIGKPQKLTEIESAAQSAQIEGAPSQSVPGELVSSPSPQPAITVPDTVDIEGGLR
jgi:outer membrane protein